MGFVSLILHKFDCCDPSLRKKKLKMAVHSPNMRVAGLPSDRVHRKSSRRGLAACTPVDPKAAGARPPAHARQLGTVAGKGMAGNDFHKAPKGLVGVNPKSVPADRWCYSNSKAVTLTPAGKGVKPGVQNIYTSHKWMKHSTCDPSMKGSKSETKAQFSQK